MITEYEVKRQIGMGKHNAIKCRHIADRLGIKDTRGIRLHIQSLIAGGLPIISCQEGYYIAENAEDCAANIKYLESYIKQLAIHRRHLKRASQKYFVGQMPMRLGL